MIIYMYKKNVPYGLVIWMGSIIFVVLNTYTMTQQADTHRELLFLISEVDETRNPFDIVNRIITSYEAGVIDVKHMELLFGTLCRNCVKYGIEGWVMD